MLDLYYYTYRDFRKTIKKTHISENFFPSADCTKYYRYTPPDLNIYRHTVDL